MVCLFLPPSGESVNVDLVIWVMRAFFLSQRSTPPNKTKNDIAPKNPTPISLYNHSQNLSRYYDFLPSANPTKLN